MIIPLPSVLHPIYSPVCTLLSILCFMGFCIRTFDVRCCSVTNKLYNKCSSQMNIINLTANSICCTLSKCEMQMLFLLWRCWEKLFWVHPEVYFCWVSQSSEALKLCMLWRINKTGNNVRCRSLQGNNLSHKDFETPWLCISLFNPTVSYWIYLGIFVEYTLVYNIHLWDKKVKTCESVKKNSQSVHRNGK